MEESEWELRDWEGVGEGVKGGGVHEEGALGEGEELVEIVLVACGDRAAYA